MSLLNDFVNNQIVRTWPSGARLGMLAIVAWLIALALIAVLVAGW